jgi:DNA-binding transcriptional ArsR family regulator/uncharacterized protein YndB with AHSA1/START domain
MSYGSVLSALADPTRRTILEQLRFGEQAAGELGRGLPITQPAVSKHLRVLREAGLVSERRAGTRRLYAVDHAALRELQAWLEGFWSDALTAFKDAAETTYERDAMTATSLPAVQHGVDLRCSADHAFTVFTERIATWWPLHQHSIGAGLEGRTAVDCVIEPRVGGRIYEVLENGTQLDWGRVVTWQPGRLLELDWNPSLTQRPYTHVEIRFKATGDGTCRIDVTHHGWEVLEQPGEARESYDAGWPVTLQLLRAAAEA